MKRIIGIAAWAACAFACASAGDFDDPEASELGSLEQPVFMPNNYGHQDGFMQCGNPFNGTCMVPDTRSFVISVHQFTCSTQQFKDQILDAANYAAARAWENGWNVSVQNLPNNATGSSHWIIKCANNGPAGTLGQTSITESVGFIWDCHDSDRGELCQFKRATSIVYENIITASAAWAAGTTTQRNNIIENVGRHELGHLLGFGHTSSGCGTDLMATCPSGNSGHTLRPYTAAQLSMLDCYNETSGTGDNC